MFNLSSRIIYILMTLKVVAETLKIREEDIKV